MYKPRRSSGVFRNLCFELPQFLHHDGPVSLSTYSENNLTAQSHSLSETPLRVTFRSYTLECQINFMLRLIAHIWRTLPAHCSRSILPSLPFFSPSSSFVKVKPKAACADGAWTQREAKKLVWSSGCINWVIDPKIGMNNMMYQDWQFLFWWRSVFFRKGFRL